jgi:hypothetical protein
MGSGHSSSSLIWCFVYALLVGQCLAMLINPSSHLCLKHSPVKFTSKNRGLVEENRLSKASNSRQQRIMSPKNLVSESAISSVEGSLLLLYIRFPRPRRFIKNLHRSLRCCSGQFGTTYKVDCGWHRRRLTSRPTRCNIFNHAGMSTAFRHSFFIHLEIRLAVCIYRLGPFATRS